MVNNYNPFVNPKLIEKCQKTWESCLDDIVKKGYTIIHKETENKTRYSIIRKDSNKPAKNIIYYLHGGIYIFPLTNDNQLYAYEFCDLRDDIEVVLLDYDTAPKFKYPTQLNQAIEVWNILTKDHRPEDIIVGGNSSGGNLSLALTLKLIKEYNVSPKACILISPWTDMTCSGKSYRERYHIDPVLGELNTPLTEEKKEKFKNSEFFCYIGDADRKDPYVSPIYGDYSTFPKCLFTVGTNEMLLDDTLVIVEQLKKHGNDVELFLKEGMFHDFPLFYQEFAEAMEGFNKIKEFIIQTIDNK